MKKFIFVIFSIFFISYNLCSQTEGDRDHTRDLLKQIKKYKAGQRADSLFKKSASQRQVLPGCPVFDARNIDKRFGPVKQLGGLCYAYAAANMMNIRRSKELKNEIIVPESIAWQTRTEESYYVQAFAETITLSVAAMTGYTTEKASPYAVAAMEPELQIYFNDLEDIFGIKSANRLNYGVLLSLMGFALANRVLYNETIITGGKYMSYDDFVKKQKISAKRNAKKGKKFFRGKNAHVEQELRRIQVDGENLPDAEIEAVLSAYEIILFSSKDIFKDVVSLDGGSLESVKDFVSEQGTVCAMNKDIYFAFRALADAPRDFFKLDYKTAAARISATAKDANSEYLAIQSLDYIKTLGLYNLGPSAYLLRHNTAVKYFQREMKKVCTGGAAYARNLSLLETDMTRCEGGNCIVFSSNGENNLRQVVQKLRKPVEIGYQVEGGGGHASLLVAVEQRGAKCVAILKDSNVEETFDGNDFAFNNEGGGYFSTDFDSLTKSNIGLLY